MHLDESDRQLRRKPLIRRLAQDLRALLPLLALVVCFAAAAMVIEATESEDLPVSESRLAAVAAAPPGRDATAGPSVDTTVGASVDTTARHAAGRAVPTPPEALRGESAVAPEPALATSRSRAARPRR